MNIMDKTVKYYSKLGEMGWCHATNKMRKDIPTDTEALLRFTRKKLFFMKHMDPDRIYIAYNLPAYHENGYEDPDLVPIFARINDEDRLKKIGFIERDPFFDCKFLYMDINEIIEEFQPEWEKLEEEIQLTQEKRGQRISEEEKRKALEEYKKEEAMRFILMDID